MEQDHFTQQAALIGLVATEAVEEPDAVARHPEVIDVVAGLAEHPDELNSLFGGNGHDPAAFVTALANGLVPYKDEPLDDAPELIEGLAVLAMALRGERPATEALLPLYA